MLRYVKRYGITALACCLLLASCRRPVRTGDSRHPLGYYYRLIAFSSDSGSYSPGKIAHVQASFSTQRDSVFWDSRNNLNDNFYITIDSSVTGNFLQQYVSLCTAGDSACVMIRPDVFFKQQFGVGQVPFFSRQDSVVKVHFRLKKLLSAGELTSVNRNLQQKEQEQIDDFISTECDYTVIEDPAGFYWIGRPEETGPGIKPGSLVTLEYKGSYLGGRFLEASPPNFEIVYGTPDQLLKGLNYVIGRLKIGQNAKIILPSRLAFGENGSSNGTVAPYTPLLYEIKITNIKEKE